MIKLTLRQKILVASLVSVSGLIAVACLALRLPEDPVVHYHDATLFRAFFGATQGTWPLKAEVVRERFGEPNRYADGGQFPWDLTTRSNSKWIYRLEVGGMVMLHVNDGEVIHAFVVPKSGNPPLDFLRTLPWSQVKHWP